MESAWISLGSRFVMLQDMTFGSESMRVGHAERAAAVESLRQACADGKLSESERDERSERARAAVTVADLNALLSDVRPLSTPPAVTGPTAPLPSNAIPGTSAYDPLVLSAGFSGEKREGPWELPPFIRAHALADNVRLDCLFATAASPVIDLEVVPGAGTVLLVLPSGWAVNVDRLTKGMGSVTSKVPREPSWGNPTIMVRGSVGMGTFKARNANWWDKKKHGLDR